MLNPFSKMTNKEKIKLLKSLEANTMFLHKGVKLDTYIENLDTVGIIINGSVQIIKTDYNGNRSIVEELEENEIFGYNMSLLDDETDLVTKEDTTVIFIDINRIMNNNDINHYNNQFLKNILLITTSIIKDRNERIKVLTKRTIRNKLLTYFDILYEKNGSKILYLPFTLTDLSDFLAIDRSAMSRELKYLKEEGFISLKHKKITLLYK